MFRGASFGAVGGPEERLSADFDHALREILRRSPSPPDAGSVAVLRSTLARERSNTDLHKKAAVAIVSNQITHRAKAARMIKPKHPTFF